jgi:23S rRNA (adenine2503-C2)-methyltransferase
MRDNCFHGRYTRDIIHIVMAEKKMGRSVFSLTSLDWRDLFHEEGVSTNSLKYWLKGLYKDPGVWIRHISSEYIEKLKSSFDFSLPLAVDQQESEDGTVKFQIRFQDGMKVETVLIPFHKRRTICLSTQVGCSMNCSFCYTGTQGLKRNLSAGEIVGQYLVAQKWLRQREPNSPNPSIVFMGQGEPLHNADEVLKAIRVLNDPQLVGIGLRQMTLSTVGYLPGFGSVSNYPKINFALSLHSPFQEERVKLIPLSARFPLSDVMHALDRIPLLPKQFITYEYLLISNLNMTDEHVKGLFELLGNRKAILNLIPFNPFPGSEYKRPSLQEIEIFKNKLVEKKLRVMVRTTKGDDILAACGQLKVNKLSRNYGK